MNELEEALGAVTATTGTALIQKYIDPLILEYVRRYSPLLQALPSKKLVGTNAYNWVTRSALPDGGAVSDGGGRPISSSVYGQSPTTVKQFQAVGAVTGFSQAVTGVIADLKRSEIDGAMTSLMWAVETSLCSGNDVATANLPTTTSAGNLYGGGPDMRGLDFQVNTFSGNLQNSIDTAGATISFSLLDQAIDLIEENASQPLGHDWMIVCSPKVNSKINQLLTNQQRFIGSADIAAGVYVPTYRDMPIVKSSFLAARSQQMGTVTPTTSTTGGTLAAGTWKYQITAVINRFGEIGASTEVSQVTSGATSTNTLTFATPTGPDGNGPILYKVWRTLVGGATGSETLLGVVAAFDDLGAAVTSIVDTGTALLLNARTQTGTAPWPTTYVDGNAGLGVRAVNQEDIYLIPKTENFIVRPYVRDFFAKELAQVASAADVMPFYIASDTALSVRAPKYVSRLARVSVAL
jgi:hypothetical protein